MLIRKAKAAETEQIGDVDVASFSNSPYGEKKGLAQNKKAQQIRWNHAKSFCHEHPDWVYVAIEDDKVIGFATLFYQPEERTGEVDNNAVLREYRGRSISTLLVNRVIKELKNLGAEQINVHTDAVPAACRVYEKVGFKLVRREGENSYYEMCL